MPLMRHLRSSLRRAARSVSERALSQDERGQLAFGFMLLTIVIFMFFALAVDTGIWALDHRTAQNQVDSAALAGALELTNLGDARTEAEFALSRNDIGNPADFGCDDLGGDWFRAEITGTGPGRIGQVEVCQRRPSEVIFSALTGVLDIMVSAKGVAAMYEEPLLYSLMAMHETACPTLNMNGQGVVQVNDGRTYTRSDCTGPQGALNVSGQGSIISAGNEVIGDTVVSNGTLSPAAEDTVWIDDPFNFLDQPSLAGVPVRANGNTNINGNTTLDPGIYRGAVRVNGGTVTLNQGLYVFQGGFTMTGGTVTSNGAEVLLYSTCPTSPCNGAKPGDLDFAGGTVTNLKGDSTRYNILFWIDRTGQVNPNMSTLKLSGQGDIQLEGIAYAIASAIDVTGGTVLDLTLNMSLIGRTITFSGQGNFIIEYDQLHAPVKREIALVE